MTALLTRDLRRAFAGGAWLPPIFFLLIATLVPFAVGPDPALLQRIGAGILWIAALTAALLPVERLIEPDRESGFFDQLALRGIADESLAAIRILAHFLSFGPLLLLSAAPAALLFGIPLNKLPGLLIALGIAVAGLSALAVAVAALTAGLPRSGPLAGLLLLPLAIPLLIFGAAAAGDPGSGALLLESAIALLIVAGAPFVAGAAIRAGRR